MVEQSRIDRAGYMRRLFDIVAHALAHPASGHPLHVRVHVRRHDQHLHPHPRRPANSTQVLPSLAFFTGILGGNLGKGAAIAMFLFPVLAGISALLLRLIRRSEVT